jgi:thymidylate kinase
MAIILEGCDCTGKSSLAKALAEKTGYEIVKGSSFEISELGQKGMFEYMKSLLNRKNIIIDRFFLSNYVYGNLFDYPTMTTAQFLVLSSKTQQKALNVYLYAHYSTIQKRLMERGDDMIQQDKISSILESYKEAMHKPWLSQKLTLQFDTSHADTNSMATLIAEMIQLQEYKMFVSEK